VFAPESALPSVAPSAGVWSNNVSSAIAAKKSPLLPIFFWLYGGDNTGGSTESYGAVENLVTLYQGEAIVMAPNFRLGAFVSDGSSSHPTNRFSGSAIDLRWLHIIFWQAPADRRSLAPRPGWHLRKRLHKHLDKRLHNLCELVVLTVAALVSTQGFLALKELRDEDPRGTSGNLALLDIQLALRWVQQNGAKFGGDPGRVTLIGQSSGGTNILALLASPASNGLFAAAISLSASPNITIDQARAEAQGRQFVANAKCDRAAATPPRATGKTVVDSADDRRGKVLDCIYRLDADAVAAATPSSWDFGGDTIPAVGADPHTDPNLVRPGLPVVDGVTVRSPLLVALAAGTVPVPVIIQTMAAEDDISPKPEFAALTSAAKFDDFVASRYKHVASPSLVLARISTLFSVVMRWCTRPDLIIIAHCAWLGHCADRALCAAVCVLTASK
jgi:acetyl esterase/lipase